MMDEALSGSGTQRSPEPGWYPDPVGRAAHRYWNGTEWTANTRGPAISPTPEGTGVLGAQSEMKAEIRAVPMPRPAPVEASPIRPADPTIGTTAPRETPKPVEAELHAPTRPESVASTELRPSPARPETGEFPARPFAEPDAPEVPRSLFGSLPETPSAPPEPTPEPAAEQREASKRPTPSGYPPTGTSAGSDEPLRIAPAPEGGSNRVAALLGALLIASAAFAGGLAVQRFVLDDRASQTGATPTIQTTTTSAASTSTTEDRATETAAEMEALQAELAAVTAQRDEALAAAAVDGDTAALEAQVANLQTHVDTMRGWFTTAILDAADAAFEAEVSRACAAEAEPTLDNTSYTNRMEPAGTHADIVAAALVCRSGDG